MRIFIAIWLSEETRKALLSAQKVLLNRFPQARAVPPDNLHLTLKFLGEVSAPEMEKVSGVLGEVASLFPPFSLTVKTAGVFPERGPVRLLWVGAEGSGLPARINRQLEGNLEKYGYPAENRFREHITVIRFRTAPQRSEIQSIINQWQEKTFGQTEVKELALVESRLTPEGSIYTTLKSFPLTGNQRF